MEEFIQAVNTGCRLFRHTLDSRSNLGETTRLLTHTATQHIENDFPLCWVIRCRLGNHTCFFILHALVNQKGGISAVIQNHVWPGRAVSAPIKDLLGAPPVLFQRLTLPGKDGDTLGVLSGSTTDHDGRCRVILGGKNVAADPTNLSSQSNQSLDEDRGLHCHVQ